jgi:DNA-binding transcriptional MerR regulator/effector-binding domain-containing protein
MKQDKYVFYTISQFAELCGTTRQTLQYYDKIGILHPSFTGGQGYRYYDSMQRYNFQLISTLKQSGCTLDEVRQVIRNKSKEQVLTALNEKRQKLEAEAKKIAMYRIVLDYTVAFLRLIVNNAENEPSLLELNHYIGIIRHVFKDAAELGSKELSDELLSFNAVCSTNESIQQYPYGYVIPKEELLSGKRRIKQIICMCHYFDFQEIPEIVPQGKYVMLQKEIKPFSETDRKEAYDMIIDFIKCNKLVINGDGYEVPADIPDFMRDIQHFHILILIPVKNENE